MLIVHNCSIDCIYFFFSNPKYDNVYQKLYKQLYRNIKKKCYKTVYGIGRYVQKKNT